jgi:isoamylase
MNADGERPRIAARRLARTDRQQADGHALQSSNGDRRVDAPLVRSQVSRWDARDGSPTPLGVTFIKTEAAYNWALYSKAATAVSLLLYAPTDLASPVVRRDLDPIRNRTGRTWHCRIKAADLGGAAYYGYSVDGPTAPGNRFDPTKVLLDPYARQVHAGAFDCGAAVRAGSNAGRGLLAAIPAPRTPFDWAGDRRLRHTHDLVVYEMHVRGFTARSNSGVPHELRGSFSGVAEKIPYLVDLGVTAVELLPVYAFIPGICGDYWGYMPISFFAPHPAYSTASAPADQIDEFRAMVKALHRAGIEVILDVVYNHTAEGGLGGPYLSYRGIDNSTYYLLQDDLQTYRNDTGTGNVLRTAHPHVRNLIIDSLRYWVNEMHVDGFRFDLASILSRDIDGRIRLDGPSIISQISSDPDFADVRLIAEPWDMATFELGRSFPGFEWKQWNGWFRDDVRKFVKSDPGRVPALMRRLYGSDDLFPDEGEQVYRPFQGVSFIDCHDGFCLYDLTAYAHKRNQDNGEQNRDGTDANHSWNCGWEGDDGAPSHVIALRKRQVKNFCALLLLSNGTPMFAMGDEFLHTQRGNNNPYNQDNETTWLDWNRRVTNADIHRFFKSMIAFRRAHPTLGRGRFWRDDVSWYGVAGPPDLRFESRSVAYYLDGSSENDSDLYVMISAYWQPLTFTVKKRARHDRPWRRVIDTSLESPLDIVEPFAEVPMETHDYVVGPRSVVVLIR